jgi:uncharacterized membrane protein YkvA (DUF1232 family)
MRDGKPVEPDEIVPPDGTSARTMQVRRLVDDLVMLLPNLVKLVARLLKDPRVPRRSKLLLGGAAAYMASPIDLIPEVIPVVGLADDLLVILFALDNLIRKSGPEIVEEHWDGPGDILSMVTEGLGLARSVIPRRVRFLMDRIAG